eukprot:TRINITY_DN67852_c0_g1_i1.p1 TRINITY_DN67852_c0_g1~~TRINITY_DN67852_c0_g1_i1.p1  ORF type:complete len:319 (+),score=58.99 TRINITY_DN67852_c0_g1_i1:76-1032(+)
MGARSFFCSVRVHFVIALVAVKEYASIRLEDQTVALDSADSSGAATSRPEQEPSLNDFVRDNLRLINGFKEILKKLDVGEPADDDDRTLKAYLLDKVPDAQFQDHVTKLLNKSKELDEYINKTFVGFEQRQELARHLARKMLMLSELAFSKGFEFHEAVSLRLEGINELLDHLHILDVRDFARPSSDVGKNYGKLINKYFFRNRFKCSFDSSSPWQTLIYTLLEMGKKKDTQEKLEEYLNAQFKSSIRRENLKVCLSVLHRLLMEISYIEEPAAEDKSHVKAESEDEEAEGPSESGEAAAEEPPGAGCGGGAGRGSFG